MRMGTCLAVRLAAPLVLVVAMIGADETPIYDQLLNERWPRRYIMGIGGFPLDWDKAFSDEIRRMPVVLASDFSGDVL